MRLRRSIAISARHTSGLVRPRLVVAVLLVALVLLPFPVPSSLFTGPAEWSAGPDSWTGSGQSSRALAMDINLDSAKRFQLAARFRSNPPLRLVLRDAAGAHVADWQVPPSPREHTFYGYFAEAATGPLTLVAEVAPGSPHPVELADVQIASFQRIYFDLVSAWNYLRLVVALGLVAWLVYARFPFLYRSVLRHPGTSVVLGAYVLYVLADGLWGEKIPVNDGTGYDGAMYAYMATLPAGELFHNRIQPYYLSRSLSPLLVHELHGAMESWGLVGWETRDYLTAFAVFNTLCLVVLIALVARMATLLEFDDKRRTLAFILLLGSHYLLKFIPYYPALTDIFNTTLSAALLYAWLARRQWLVVVCISLGILTYPPFLTLSLPFLFFPRPSRLEGAPVPAWMHAAGRAACVGVAAAFVIGATYQIWKWDLTPARLMAWGLWSWLVWCSAVVAASVVLYRQDFYGKTLAAAWRQVSIPGILAAIVLYAAKVAILKIYADRTPRFNMGSEDYIGQLLISPLLYPGVNFVAALFLAGPVMLLFIAAYARLAGRSLDWGAAAAGWFLAFSLLCIDSETRRLNGFLPFLAVLAAAAVPAAFLTTRNLLYMALLGLLFSKVWFPINAFGNPFPNKEVTDPLGQLYFMHQGPFIYDARLYTGMVVGSLAALAACALLLRRARDGDEAGRVTP